MSRWLGLVDDPTAGGSTYEDLKESGVEKKGINIPSPTLWVPGTSAQVDAGLNKQDRKDEVRGRRGNTAPISFASAPAITFEARAYPPLLRKILRKALGGTVTHAKEGWKEPEPSEDTIETLTSGSLPALIMWLLREEQLDRLAGVIVSEVELNFPIDGEGTIKVSGEALWHDSAKGDMSGVKDPNGEAIKAAGTPSYTEFEDTFMLRDATAKRGSEEAEIEDLAGFKLTFNNGMITDFQSKYRPNHNIVSKEIDEVTHKLWLPQRHKVGAQTITGSIELSSADVDSDQRYLLTHAEQLIFEVAAGPLGTTPAADEMLRLVIGQYAPTGGGAEPLVREGDQRSSYDFEGFIDPATGEDLAATFVGATQLT